MKRAVLFQRIVFLLIAFSFLLNNQVRLFLFSLPIVIVLSGFYFLAKKDHRFVHVEALFLFLFIASFVSPKLGFPLDPSVLGVDKAFHLAAGFLLGFTGMLVFINEFKDKWALYLAVVSFACAFGFVWEVYEWMTLDVFRITLEDTVLDVIAVTLGSVLFLPKTIYRHFLHEDL